MICLVVIGMLFLVFNMWCCCKLSGEISRQEEMNFIEMPNGWAKENYKGGKQNVNEDNPN